LTITLMIRRASVMATQVKHFWSESLPMGGRQSRVCTAVSVVLCLLCKHSEIVKCAPSQIGHPNRLLKVQQSSRVWRGEGDEGGEGYTPAVWYLCMHDMDLLGLRPPTTSLHPSYTGQTSRWTHPWNGVGKGRFKSCTCGMKNGRPL